MITLALAQMVYFFCVQIPFTGGEDGIQSIPRGSLFGVIPLATDISMYWVTAIIFLLGFLLVLRVVHSPFGMVLKSIRENEPRATSLGYRTDDYKLVAFILSAGLAGVAGGLKSIVFGIATLTDVFWTMSGEVVLMSLVGGLGTIFGPVVGAAVIITMQNYLAEFGAWVTVIQGVIFVLCVLAFRRGVVGEIGGGGCASGFDAQPGGLRNQPFASFAASGRMTLAMVPRTTSTRTLGAISTSSTSWPSTAFFTSPTMPPAVTTRSPRLRLPSIAFISRIFFCCGRISRK
jgi:hypothetical protein